MILADRYKNLDSILSCDGSIEEPEIVEFFNSDKACKMLDKHLYSNERVLIHADVDFDGIGSAYEMMKYFEIRNNAKSIKMCINSAKKHGISKPLVGYANNLEDLGLLVIVDSSSSNIDLIKQVNADVLVIDHHEIRLDKSELSGKTANGEYVIVSNVVEHDKDYSCGLVIYEFLRYYQRARGLTGELEKSLLYQWAVCTLFTDVINTDNVRNLYYITKALDACVVENNLKQLLDNLCRTNNITKTAILFSLAPCINAAIRGGRSTDALKIATKEPWNIGKLATMKVAQREMLDGVEKYADNSKRWADLDIGKINLSRSYTGIVASMLVERYKKSSIAYVVVNGYACGSFRGLKSDFNYLAEMQACEVYAEGHPPAFGFEIPLEKLDEVMDRVAKFDGTETSEYLVYTGCSIKAEHVISDIDAFRKDGNIWKIGMINAKMAGGVGNCNIIFPKSAVKLIEEHEKYFDYECAGLHCKAFEPIVSTNVLMYIEYSTELVLYLRNKWDA